MGNRSPLAGPAFCALVGAVLVGALGWGLTSGSFAEAQERPPRIPLLVRETAGVARRAEPVSVGVPLPARAGLHDPDAFVILDPSGAPQPTQARVLSRWHGPPEDTGRPIRWIAVRFQADVPAGGTAEYSLTVGDAPDGLADIVRQDASDLVVDTGPLGFRVSGERFRILEDLRIDINGDGTLDVALVAANHDGGVFVKSTDGSPARAVDDAQVQMTLEENGPLAAVIRIDGRHLTDTATPAAMEDGRPPHPWLEFTARLHAYRDQPWLRLEYSVRNPDRFLTGAHNRGGEPVAHVFDSLSLILPLQTLGDPLTLTLGGEASSPWAPPMAAPPAEARPAWQLPLPTGSTAVLYQDSSGVEGWHDSSDGTWGTTFRGYVASMDRQAIGRGHHAAGWGDVSSLAWGVTVGVRNFWQSFPKGLRFSGRGRIAVDLWPEEFRLAHRLEGGRQKTHEVFLDFHRGAGPDVAAFSAFQSPLRAAAPAAWYRDTLALGPVGVIGEREAPETWRLRQTAGALLDSTSGLRAERVRFDVYGWRHFGDSYRAGDKEHRAFGNNEFDFGFGLLSLYLLSDDQNPAFLDLAEPILRHLADIDIYHTGEDSDTYSWGVRQHDGGGSVDHSRPPILSHYWIRGLIAYHWITGERWPLEAAEGTARWLETLIDPATGELDWHPQSRSQAWAALALTELWEATGKRVYLEQATRLLHTEILGDRSPAGDALPCADLDWEGDAGETQRKNASPWQNGYVAEALGRYALARRLAGSPDTAAEEGLYRLLDDLGRCGFATPDNGLFVAGDEHRDDRVYGRRYRSLVLDRIHADGRYTIEYPNNHLLTDGFAYGALFTRDPERRQRYLDLARESWIWTMGPESAPGEPRSQAVHCCPDSPAKNSAMHLRFGHVWLWLQQRMGDDSAP